jgi:DNA-binding transcriptional LysR family regulator
MAICVACNPQKRLSRLLMKYPELRDTVVIHDTVEAIVEYVRADTVVRWKDGDTIYLTKDRLRVRTVIDHDTVWQMGECLADTIRVPYRVEVPVVQPLRTIAQIPWWYWVMVGALILAVILTAMRR